MLVSRILPVVAFLVFVTTQVVAEEPELRWLKRIDEARPVAAESKKDLLISFTGHGWCHYCELLDRAVLKQSEFALEAPKDFVLVEIDFAAEPDEPRDPAEERLQKLYAKWKKEYLIQGVPHVVLADAAGKPYAYLSYYDEITPEKFLATLQKAQAARAARDKYLSEAQAATTDLARADKLHSALQAISTWLGTKEERGADPLLTHYADLVAAIQRFDADNADGVREVYDRRIAARDAWVRSEQVFKELDKFGPAKDYAGAIAYLDKVLPTVDDDAMRWRLEHARQVYLEWDGQYEMALENARRLSQIKSITSAEHEWTLGREAFNLVNCQRFDEYLDRWAQRFASAVDHPAVRLKLLSEKSQYYLHQPDVKGSIAAWRDYRKATGPFSDDWENGTFLLARELARGGEYLSAISLWQELLAHYRAAGRPETAHVMLSIADAQRAGGMLDDARRSIAAVDAALATEPLTPTETRFLEQRLVALKEAMRRRD